MGYTTEGPIEPERRDESQQPDEQFFCPFDAHEWNEEYYGYKCKKCDAFIPYGSEPWLPETDERDEE